MMMMMMRQPWFVATRLFLFLVILAYYSSLVQCHPGGIKQHQVDEGDLIPIPDHYYDGGNDDDDEIGQDEHEDEDEDYGDYLDADYDDGREEKCRDMCAHSPRSLG